MGSNNEEVLREWLQMSPSEIEVLRQEGVI
jgi:hypothetical protein